jgi:hypothetical protein
MISCTASRSNDKTLAEKGERRDAERCGYFKEWFPGPHNQRLLGHQTLAQPRHSVPKAQGASSSPWSERRRVSNDNVGKTRPGSPCLIALELLN